SRAAVPTRCTATARPLPSRSDRRSCSRSLPASDSRPACSRDRRTRGTPSCRSSFARTPRSRKPDRYRSEAGGIRSRKSEHREHAALVAEVRQVLEGTNRAETSGWIFKAHVRGDADARPSANTGEHRDVLLVVWTDVRHRIADDAGRRLELPQ